MDDERTRKVMIPEELELIGTTYDLNVEHKDWWTYEQEQERLCQSVTKKNAYCLKDIFRKIHEQGVTEMKVPFSGGHDEGGFEGEIHYYDKDGKELKLNYDKIQPGGWLTFYKPFKYLKKINDSKSEVSIFEHKWTEYDKTVVTEDWLISKFYDFGFLEDYGSFAGEFSVSGEVVITPANGNYNVEANETLEEYECKEWDGNMFNKGDNND